MRNIGEEKWTIWESGQFVGDNRPVGRAEISKSVLNNWELSSWRTLLFGQSSSWYETPTIKTITINKRTGQDAAQMTITFVNQTPIDGTENLDLTHAGTAGTPTRRSLKDIGQPGFYTFRRGMLDRDGANPWGHGEDPTWVDMFIPNRVIRTFQGYGTDGAGIASADTKLDLTGYWLIDSVGYKGVNVVVNCRDFAKLLIEQRLYPPIIPLEHYPLEFCSEHDEIDVETIITDTLVTTTQEAVTGPDVGAHVSSGWDSSVAPWYGYDSGIYGHRASHAFDADQSSYWLSVGNSGPNQPWSFEWIEATTRGEPINQIYVRPKWGGYVMYVAVKVGGVWQGTNTVPYGYTSEPAYPNGSNVKYVTKYTFPAGEAYQTIDLPQTYQADSVRLVFTNLQDSNLGTWQYRAGVYDFQTRLYTPPASVTTGEKTEEERETTITIPGNLDDYTDIIKVLCGWSGFYWPLGTPDDPILTQWGAPGGRIWGDFMYSGAYPVEPPCIPATFWDNKSVMDGINQIKEILGFIFHIDPTGGVIWRPPNIWRTGNWIGGTGYVGEDSIRTASEQNVLIDYGVTIDDQSLRSEIVVVSAEDPTLSAAYGTGTGWMSNEGSPSTVFSDLSLLGGQQRVMLVPNYPFQSAEEVEKFAFLISLWIHWSYRTSRFRIPGSAGFEIDDQIRIFERNSSELFIHYIQGISSTMDLDAGTWYMDIDTHWLGNGPDAEWLVNIDELAQSPALTAYLAAIGQLTDDVIANLPPLEVPEVEIPDDVPRLDGDLDSLFPDPPEIVWPDVTWDSEAPTGGEYITPPDASGSGGSAYACSNAAKFSYWGSGPLNRYPTGSSWKCNTEHLRTYTLLYKWNAVYGGGFWPADEPIQEGLNTHANQTASVSVRIDRRAAAAYRLLARIISEEEYNVTSAYGYDCRPVYRSASGYSDTSWSNHSWGLAVDINAAALGDTGKTTNSTVITIGSRAVNKIRCGNGQKVFRWGQDYGDPMHFEVCCTPDDLATGVVLNP